MATTNDKYAYCLLVVKADYVGGRSLSLYQVAAKRGAYKLAFWVPRARDIYYTFSGDEGPLSEKF